MNLPRIVLNHFANLGGLLALGVGRLRPGSGALGIVSVMPGSSFDRLGNLLFACVAFLRLCGGKVILAYTGFLGNALAVNRVRRLAGIVVQPVHQLGMVFLGRRDRLRFPRQSSCLPAGCIAHMALEMEGPV